MPLVSIIITLIVVGVLLWLVNTYLAQFIDGKILQIINVIVVVLVILWLLDIVFGFGVLSSIRIGSVPRG